MTGKSLRNEAAEGQPTPRDSREAVIEKLHGLIAEIWQSHRDKDSADYNECEEAECMWCEQTREALALLKEKGTA